MSLSYKDIEQYQLLHKQQTNYGASGHSYTDLIINFIKRTRPKTILDFGCGKETLKSTLSQHGIHIDGYDPAISGKESPPLTKYDLIITTDVLEHIHEEELDRLFSDMLSFDPVCMYHVICNRAAYSVLPDGTNAHKTIKDNLWWSDKLKLALKDFNINTVKRQDTTHCELIKKRMI
jgi:2-polyprenyl-3-methyl-5-hydroxy-6-metoxy-1,4-benzoquinol methylase